MGEEGGWQVMLSEMTLRIAGMRATGKTVAEIATELHLSRQQVGGHLGRWEAEQKRRRARADKRAEARRAEAETSPAPATRTVEIHMDMDPRRAVAVLSRAFRALESTGAFWNGYGIAMQLEGNRERSDAAQSSAKLFVAAADEVAAIHNEMVDRLAEALS